MFFFSLVFPFEAYLRRVFFLPFDLDYLFSWQSQLFDVFSIFLPAPSLLRQFSLRPFTLIHDCFLPFASVSIERVPLLCFPYESKLWYRRIFFPHSLFKSTSQNCFAVFLPLEIYIAEIDRWILLSFFLLTFPLNSLGDFCSVPYNPTKFRMNIVDSTF